MLILVLVVLVRVLVLLLLITLVSFVCLFLLDKAEAAATVA